jgi:hypothetical protein
MSKHFGFGLTSRNMSAPLQRVGELIPLLNAAPDRSVARILHRWPRASVGSSPLGAQFAGEPSHAILPPSGLEPWTWVTLTTEEQGGVDSGDILYLNLSSQGCRE